MDALIDSTTRDYSGTRTTTLANASYLRLATPLGAYWADPSVGSLLHTLEREKDVPRVRLLAEQYAEQALAPLLRDARSTRVSVAASSGTKGWLILSIEVVDAKGDPHHFNHHVKVS